MCCSILEETAAAGQDSSAALSGSVSVWQHDKNLLPVWHLQAIKAQSTVEQRRADWLTDNMQLQGNCHHPFADQGVLLWQLGIAASICSCDCTVAALKLRQQQQFQDCQHKFAGFVALLQHSQKVLEQNHSTCKACNACYIKTVDRKHDPWLLHNAGPPHMLHCFLYLGKCWQGRVQH
jgi:hypothetical protein